MAKESSEPIKIPYASIDVIDGVYVATVKGTVRVHASTGAKCATKLAKYIKSQS